MKSSFFVGNRQRLEQQLTSKIVVLAGYELMQRSNDAAYPFEQEANFWYLTGIESPGWTLVIEPKKSWLIAPEVDEVHQLFDGSLSFGDAKKISGVDEVLSHSEGKELIDKLAKKNKSVATLGKDPRAKHYDFVLNPAPVILLRQLKKIFTKVEDCRLTLARLRAIKQPDEIQAIRQAVKLTVGAFEIAKANLSTYEFEYQVEADFTNIFKGTGAKGHAYDPIIASGERACTLHYNTNSQPVEANQLLLLDIGARLNGYAADITRTYIKGTPTKRQVAVHAAVESAHQEIIKLLKPGLSVIDYQNKVDEIMKSKLQDLGLLEKPENYRKYFPHAISHGLGIDVHDALGRPEIFKAGMVLTVEPGIYIPEEGIGIRIEDDILITENGHENLSAALPTSL